MPVFCYILICASLVAVRELCFKHAANNTSVRKTLLKPLTWFGIFLWAAELALWLRVLQLAPLGVAFPSMAISYVMIIFGSAIFLRERISRTHAMGAGLILVGVALLGIST